MESLNRSCADKDFFLPLWLWSDGFYLVTLGISFMWQFGSPPAVFHANLEIIINSLSTRPARLRKPVFGYGHVKMNNLFFGFFFLSPTPRWCFSHLRLWLLWVGEVKMSCCGIDGGLMMQVFTPKSTCCWEIKVCCKRHTAAPHLI